ncbi:MAG: radical SAM protein [Bacillota bacterium]|nr:radical SAM protein [Bacillota bacterium]
MKILPFFLPMSGCPFQCIYCDQVAISGESGKPTPQQVAAQAAAFDGGTDAELAFYGGTFTALPVSEQDAYLQAAGAALSEGRIGGIRISTRPDCIDEPALTRLREQGVRTVELGIQSFDDEVLRRSGRGYTAQTAIEACRAVKDMGLRLGVQMMTGLPGDDRDKALATARRTVALDADMARIYPLLVLRDTPLARLWERGGYQPQTTDDAAELCAELLAVFTAAELPVIRIGLNAGADVEQALLAGPYHPAFGAIVKTALKRRQIEYLLDGAGREQAAIIGFPREDTPLVFGQDRRNMLYLGRAYPYLALMPLPDLAPGEISLTADEKTVKLGLKEFCERQYS